MPVNPSWTPSGWVACEANCESPKTAEEKGKQVIWCRCVDACLHVRQCGCRLVRRKKIERNDDDPDGWDLGPVEMVQTTCDVKAEYDSRYLYKCLCLERVAPTSGVQQQALS